MLQLQKFKPEQWPLYREVRLTALKDSPDAFGSTYEQACLYEDANWQARLSNVNDALDCPMGVFSGETAVGLAWGSIAADNRDRADLFQMWTSPEYRGQGMGRALVEHIVEWAAKQGASELILAVTVGNRVAEGLYVSVGFEPFGEQERLRPGVDKWVTNMRLALV